MAKAKKTEQVKTETCVFVYLGPSIRGVIQSGTIYSGTREEVENALASAIERYPKVKALVVKDTEIADAKRKIKAGGNAISMAYKSLLA